MEFRNPMAWLEEQIEAKAFKYHPKQAAVLVRVVDNQLVGETPAPSHVYSEDYVPVPLRKKWDWGSIA